MITDIAISFQNYLQDFGNKFDNTCMVYFDTGEIEQADSTMQIEWQWSTVMPDSNGMFVKTIISQAFNLKIADVAHLLKNGEFLLELKARDTLTGKTWSRIIPAFLQHELVSGNWPNYMPHPESLTAAQYREQVYLHTWAAPHLPGLDFEATKPGDINGDGVVNISDLLLLSSNFGQ